MYSYLPKIFVCTFIVFACACGPNSSEIALRQQQLLDSTKLATQTIIEQQMKLFKDSIAAAERKRQLQKEAKKRRIDKSMITAAINDYNNEIFVQQDKLEGLRQPKFLRTRDERETDLRNQMSHLQQLQNAKEKLQQLVQDIDNGVAYQLPEKFRADVVRF